LNAPTGEIDTQMSYGFRWMIGDIWQEYGPNGWTTVNEHLSSTHSGHDPISFGVGQGEWRFAIKLQGDTHDLYWSYTVVVLDRTGLNSTRTIFPLRS
jgi:hypothetical protein